MRIVYMGTPDFAVPALEALIGSHHKVIAAVTQPDKPKGRGKSMQCSDVKITALKHQIPVYQPVRVRDEAFFHTLEELAPDVIVVAAFGQILSQAVLELPQYGCINLHASLLPKYRGAAPIQWAIIDGEKETGVTAMKMDAGIDTGDMLKKVSIPIEKKETGESLTEKLAKLGGDLILDVLKETEEGTLIGEKQDDSLSCYAKMLKKSMGKIDWNRPAAEIECLIRGLNSWPSAYTSFHNKMLKIWEADVESINSSETPGEIVKIEKDALWIQTGDGCLLIKEVQLEGKKRMEADVFLRGNTCEIGTILGNF